MPARDDGRTRIVEVTHETSNADGGAGRTASHLKSEAGLRAAAAQRYASSGRLVRHYVASKLSRDPVHRALLNAAPELGHVADIGCGRGQLSVLLLLAGRARGVVGIDRNGRHLDQARRAATGLAFTPVLADLGRTAEIPGCDTAVLVDILYQLAPEAQRTLLVRAARAARTRVLIRTLDPDQGLRSHVSLLAERTVLRLTPNSGARVAPAPVTEIAETLLREGFRATVTPCWRGTPFANVLLSARRL